MPSGMLCAFQQRALFDVQFDEGGVVARCQDGRFERAGETGRRAQFDRACDLHGRAGGDPHRKFRVPASRRLPRHPMPKRVGSSEVKSTSSMERVGLYAGALQRADGFQSAEHADSAVVHAGIRNGVDVGTGGYRGEFGRLADPAREGVAHGIFADLQARFRAERLHVMRGRGRSACGKDHARNGRRGHVGDRWLAVPVPRSRRWLSMVRFMRPGDGGSNLCR